MKKFRIAKFVGCLTFRHDELGTLEHLALDPVAGGLAAGDAAYGQPAAGALPGTLRRLPGQVDAAPHAQELPEGAGGPPGPDLDLEPREVQRSGPQNMLSTTSWT